ncbi:hypothetical protein NC652_007976 [Populus alba x Populus x berolinensis]|nr:hypothetical protein NC652_007976 [Populus alba x Populus x berolinensis]
MSSIMQEKTHKKRPYGSLRTPPIPGFPKSPLHPILQYHPRVSSSYCQARVFFFLMQGSTGSSIMDPPDGAALNSIVNRSRHFFCSGEDDVVTAGSDHVSLITVVPPDATGDVDITCSSVVLMAAFKKTNGKSLVQNRSLGEKIKTQFFQPPQWQDFEFPGRHIIC